jgi:antitoxin (DNA-binding transcriptional repressor) of toxin-antitoxin stability system
MRTVGVKQLKARLSEYLRAVRAGETVLVTHHDEVVAEIRPPRRSAAPDEVEARLRSLAEAGDVTRAELPRRGWTWRSAGLGLPEGAAGRLLDGLRADR